MTTTLLQTKLYIPLPRPDLVPRPRLLERLNAGLRGKLTLASAPAGFGKTTLLSEWIAGWLSLDEGDNDPAEEAAVFLNDIMGPEPPARDIATLETRTEGWIAGLQMAALSMRGGQDAAAFSRAFSGSHRFVLDYLVEEVLDQQPDDVRQFLLKTSLLERMNGPLCDAVLENGAPGQEMLERLEQANLFVTPLDDERCWYRYHHLFADLLRSRLGDDNSPRWRVFWGWKGIFSISWGKVFRPRRWTFGAGSQNPAPRARIYSVGVVRTP